LNSDANQSKVDSDLADRLDTLFDENEATEDSGKAKGQSQDPLDELKSLVMSIEWEITDDVMERFLSQVDSVKTRFEEDRILVMFLQLLGSLGLYVKTNKGKAHPNAFKLLNSVYASFEKAASPGIISPSEKKKLLYVELNKYKELKGQIETVREPEPAVAHGGGASSESKGQAQPGGTRQEDAPSGKPGSAVTQRHFDTVIDHLKTSLLNELAAIREEIAHLKG
jgi:hypothetical protein